MSQGWRECAGLSGATSIPPTPQEVADTLPMPPCPHSGSPPRSGARNQTDSFSPTPTSEIQAAAQCPATSPSPDLLGLNLRSPTVQQGHSKSAEETLPHGCAKGTEYKSAWLRCRGSHEDVFSPCSVPPAPGRQRGTRPHPKEPLRNREHREADIMSFVPSIFPKPALGHKSSARASPVSQRKT